MLSRQSNLHIVRIKTTKVNLNVEKCPYILGKSQFRKMSKKSQVREMSLLGLFLL